MFDHAQVEREKALAEEKEREKERIRQEKEREKQQREQEKIEERERKKAEKEKEREKARLERERRELAALEERQRAAQAARAIPQPLLSVSKKPASVSVPIVETVTASIAKDVSASAKVAADTAPETETDETVGNAERDDDDDHQLEEDVANLTISDCTTAPSAISDDISTKPESAMSTSPKSEQTPEEIDDEEESPEDLKPAPKPAAKAKISNPLMSIIASAVSRDVSTKPKPAPSAASANATPAPAPAQPIVVRYSDCPQPRVGLVIGAKGSIISEIMKRTGCKMSINQDFPDGVPRKVIYTGTSDQISAAKVLVTVIIEEGPNAILSAEVVQTVASRVKLPSHILKLALGPLDPVELPPPPAAPVKATPNPVEAVATHPAVSKEHFSCHLCTHGQSVRYYNEYRELEAHYKKDHFACEDEECLQKRNVVFKSVLELQAHNRTAHSSTKAAPVETSPLMSGGVANTGSSFASDTTMYPSIRNRPPQVPQGSILSPAEFPSLGAPGRPGSGKLTPELGAAVPDSPSVSSVGMGSASGSVTGSMTGSMNDMFPQSNLNSNNLNGNHFGGTLANTFGGDMGGMGIASEGFRSTLGASPALQPPISALLSTQMPGPISGREKNPFVSAGGTADIPSALQPNTHGSMAGSQFSMQRGLGQQGLGFSSSHSPDRSLLTSDLAESFPNLSLNAQHPPQDGFGGSSMGGTTSLQSLIAESNEGFGSSSTFGNDKRLSGGSVSSTGGLNGLLGDNSGFSSMAHLGSLTSMGSLSDPQPLSGTSSLFQDRGTLGATSMGLGGTVSDPFGSNQAFAGIGGLGASLGANDSIFNTSMKQSALNSSADAPSGSLSFLNGINLNMLEDDEPKSELGSSGLGGSLLSANDPVFNPTGGSLIGQSLLSGTERRAPGLSWLTDTTPAGFPISNLDGHTDDADPDAGDADDGADDAVDGVVSFSARTERHNFAPDFIEKLIYVLKCYPKGILGSQFPEAYMRVHKQKLVLENNKGRKLKLLHVLDGHPNVRKEKAGTWKWFYQEAATADRAKSAAGIAGAGAGAGNSAEGAEGVPGMEVDILPPEAFPAMSWLHAYNMHMYRWAGNAVEWTEYALHLPPYLAATFEEADSPLNLEALKLRTGCGMSICTETLNSKHERFLVFVRGSSGSPSNATMDVALGLVSNILHVMEERGQLKEVESSLSKKKVQKGPPLHVPGAASGGASAQGLADGKVTRVLDIPQESVGLVAGKGGKKLHAMRKKSGAYMNLVSKMRSTEPAKLTISGSAESVEIAVSMALMAYADKEKE
jgi:hypothetical protein